MKDNISIIFAAIIATFLIVLLPLYSILDRQDSMSYNVVLTATTNFVDEIRNNGFVDRDSYYNYISKLASTANTYKVTIEGYKKTLIRDVDNSGNVIQDSFVEQVELYNTKDILQVLEGETNQNTDNSNKQNNVYLFNENDEIYVKVHNTNTTAGSVIYQMLAGASNKEVINVSYGGLINNVNWELYDKIISDTTQIPEVILSVPVNARNESNLKKVTSAGNILDVDCNNAITVEEEKKCLDAQQTSIYHIYLYDLGGKKIGVNKYLSDDNIVNIPGVGEKTISEIYKAANRYELLQKLKNAIKLNNINASVDVSLIQESEINYTLNILLSNVQMEERNYLSNSANIEITTTNDDISGAVILGTKAAQVDSQRGESYTYLYDLSVDKNKTISFAMELRRIVSIDVGKTEYVAISDLLATDFNSPDYKSETEKHIINNYIRLNGMSADVDLRLRRKGDYYVFDVELTNVKMSSLDYISTLASVTVLQGLGKDESGTLSLGGQTVELELTDITAVNTVIISMPHIYQRLFKTKSLEQSRILAGEVFADEDLVFVISYTGINGYTDEEIKQAVKENLKIYATDSDYSNVELYTVQEFRDKHFVNLATDTAGHIIVKFRYTEPNRSAENYIQLLQGWITTSTEEEIQIGAHGATSSYYKVSEDNWGPFSPDILIDGTLGNNNWYITNVILTIDPATNDMKYENVRGGSGVDRNTLRLTGANKLDEQELAEPYTHTITKDGETTAYAAAYDFIQNRTNGYNGNVSSVVVKTIKIDKTPPTKPTITLSGTKDEGSNWYKDKVTAVITPGTDATSGVNRTEYRLEGAQEETGEGTLVTIEEDGVTKIIATTYDNAGNVSEEQVTEVYIDSAEPPIASMEVVSGTIGQNNWYKSPVTIRITVDKGDTKSGLGTTTCRILGNNPTPTEYNFNELQKDIQITENGIHQITIITRTNAGKTSTNKYTIRIDKNSPNAPQLNIVRGTLGSNGWYTSEVEVEVVAQGDIGPSVEKTTMSYKKIYKDGNEVEGTINNNSRIYFNEEGEYTFSVTTSDMAGNSIMVSKHINIDKKLENAAEFIIQGEHEDGNEWYKGPVSIFYEGAQDSVSGIADVILSHTEISEDTQGTEVTLTTKDKAGHTVTKTKNIKVDSTEPTLPKINPLSEVTSEEVIPGVLMYNKNVNVEIIPGTDTNVAKTTYMMTQDGKIIVEETVGTSCTVQEQLENDPITLIVRTYDEAGNYSETSKVFWINSKKPSTPKIISINDRDVENDYLEEIISTSNKLQVLIYSAEEGAYIKSVKALLQKEDTGEIIEQVLEVPDSNETIELSVEQKGTYTLNIVQTNIWGSTSVRSQGVYKYTYIDNSTDNDIDTNE